jgi:pimeloyl-ACP methyl ester carboxylesterase
MPYATADDGVKLYYEEAGSGFPLIFVHEFAGDHRSWEPQIRFFSRFHRCIVYDARGYPPSDVPEEVTKYSQARAADDIASVLRHLEIFQAHVCGLSMGGFATLHFGLRHAKLARSLAICGCGYGAEPAKREAFRQESEALAKMFESEGSAKTAAKYALGSGRVQFQNKDPRGWKEFVDRMAEHSAKGSANTMRGVQKERPSLWDLLPDIRKITLPVLIIAGDEDEACIEPGLLLKRNIPSAGLVLLPKTGHIVNLEEPEAFNRVLLEFLHAVEAGRWSPRDPRAAPGPGVHGMR